MAFTAVIGLASGTAAVTAATVLAAVAEVGLAMTVVGGVTGNKSLLKIGGVMSLVGGVGGLAVGAAGGGAAAGAAGAESAGASLLSEGASGAASLGSEAAAGALDAGMATTSAIANPTSLQPTALGELGSQTAALAPGEMAVTANAGTSPGIVNSTVNDVAGAQGPVGAQAPVTPADGNWQGGVTDPATRAQLGLESQSGSAPVGFGDFFKRFSTFAEKNKTLFNSGMQLAGGALKGANERDMFDQKVALEQQRLNLTNKGSQTANFAPGIIAGARA